MSRLDDLIRELCPEGVRWAPLGEIASVTIGEFVKKTLQSEEFQFPVYNGGTTETGFYSRSNSPEHSIVISARGSIGFVNYLEKKFWAGNSCYVARPKDDGVMVKFLYYFLKKSEWGLYALRSIGGIPAINLGPVLKFEIPVPPLPVQEEIVRILDTYTELEAELEAELAARKTQSEVVHDSLVSFDGDLKGHPLAEMIEESCPDGVSLVALSEICEVFSGYPFDSRGFNLDGMGELLVRIRDVNSGPSGTYYSGAYDDRFLVTTGDLLVSMDGDFRALRWPHGRGLLNQRVCRLQNFSESANPSFVFYEIQSHLDRIHAELQASTVKHLSTGALRKSLIPLPTLPVQDEIVRILDSFDSLVHDISSGLPAEIAARRKQYEYYRDKLLTFEEIAA